MIELMIDMLISDALTALERKEISIFQYDNRIKNLEKMREDIKDGKRS